MLSPSTVIAFWSRWLIVVVVGVMLFGLGMVIAPGYTRQFFSLLLHGSAEHTAGFTLAAVAWLPMILK